MGGVTQADVYEDFLGSDHSPVGMKVDLTSIIEKQALIRSILHYKTGSEKAKQSENLATEESKK